VCFRASIPSHCMPHRGMQTCRPKPAFQIQFQPDRRSCVYVLNPARSSQMQLILFYSNECPHCHKLIDECKCCRIKVQTLPVKYYSKILKALGIKDVPVLLVNDSREKKIIVGKKKIEEYLKLANQDAPILHPYTGFMAPEAHPQDACSLDEPCTRKK